MTPSEDDFLRWRDDPVTRWVFTLMEYVAEQNKADWIMKSWDAGLVDPSLRLQLATRADAYRAIIEITHEDLCALEEAKSGNTEVGRLHARNAG